MSENRDLREFAHSLTRRLVEDDTPDLEELVAPEIMSRLDSADSFLSDVYDDIVDAVSTRPLDPGLESGWRGDGEFLDVIIDHHLLTLPESTAVLAKLRKRVQKRHPTTRAEVVAYVQHAFNDMKRTKIE